PPLYVVTFSTRRRSSGSLQVPAPALLGGAGAASLPASPASPASALPASGVGASTPWYRSGRGLGLVGMPRAFEQDGASSHFGHSPQSRGHVRQVSVALQ